MSKNDNIMGIIGKSLINTITANWIKARTLRHRKEEVDSSSIRNDIFNRFSALKRMDRPTMRNDRLYRKYVKI